MKQEGILFILSAPSGAGKTTVCKILQERIPDLKFSVSHTTRPPRPNEIDGVDYYFISEEDFKAKIEEDDFLEWAEVHNHLYGTALRPIYDLKNDGYDIILELDAQGAATLRKTKEDGVFILMLPPSLQELENRLKKRSTEPASQIQQRLEAGKFEIRQSKIYDYIVTNHELEETVDVMLAILKAEKFRANRYRPTSPDIETILNQQGNA
ncbi:MAG: guanylate kinase [Nitrospinales bacterium]